MRRRVGRLVLLLVGVTVTLVLLPVAINVATGGTLPGFLAPYAGWVWPVVGILWLGVVTLTVWEFRRGDDGGITTRFPDHPKNRPNSLDRVDRLVGQRLHNSLGEKVRIALALDEHRDQVIRQSTLRVQPVDSAPREHLGSVHEAFELLDGSMLVLGAPGAGKTTMLLELTQSLVALARDDEQQPVPVLVELSGWSRRSKENQSFTEWLLAEVNRQYGIPAKVGETWLSDGKLALLLDGLDEVAEADRDGCVRELNQLQDRFLIPQLMVSSRERDYQQLTSKLRLHGAVTIRPLSHHQVFDYLYFHDIEVDADLLGMLGSPLMLNIVLLALRDGRRRLGSSRKRLFDAYVVEVLTRRHTPATKYQPEQAIRLLWFLAKNSEGAIVPGRFDRPYTRFRFRYEVPRAVTASMTRLFLPAAYGAVVACGALLMTLRFGWWTSLLLLALSVLFVPLLGNTFVFSKVPEPHPVPVRVLWPALGAAVGAALGAGGILAGDAVVDLILRLPEVWIGVVFTVVTALVVASWKMFGWGDHEWTTATLKWGLITAAATGTLVLLFGLPRELLIGWGIGLGLAPGFGVLTFLHSYCQAHEIDDRRVRAAKEHRKSHLKLTGRAATVGGAAGLLAGLLLGDAVGGPAWPAFLGLAVGLTWSPAMTWSWAGWQLRSITDAVLRIALTAVGYVPLRTKGFLRYASDRSLLVAADGTYRFVHALVQDHLATCDPDALAGQIRQRLAGEREG